MNKKVVTQFTLLTFGIMIITWGVCVVCGRFEIILEKHFWLYIPYIIGAFSPTIASYAVLKKNNEINGIKEWIKTVFAFKNSIWFYLLVIVLSLTYFVPQIIINGLQNTQPFYLFFILLPVVLVGGGMEEAGWRYILQPELDKKFGHIFTAIIVAVIWSAWHIPLYFIPGIEQYGGNFWLFALDVLGLSFALGAIRKISNNVFLCVLFHCIHNAGSVTFNIPDTLYANSISTGITIMLSIIMVVIYNVSTRFKNKKVNPKSLQREKSY